MPLSAQRLSISLNVDKRLLYGMFWCGMLGYGVVWQEMGDTEFSIHLSSLRKGQAWVRHISSWNRQLNVTCPSHIALSFSWYSTMCDHLYCHSDSHYITTLLFHNVRASFIATAILNTCTHFIALEAVYYDLYRILHHSQKMWQISSCKYIFNFVIRYCISCNVNQLFHNL